MEKIITAVLLSLFINCISAQQIVIKSFRVLENDQEARVISPKLDQNGKKCAIIKIVTSQAGFTFDFGMIGDALKTEQKTGELWIWVPVGARKITINHQKFGVLRNYEFSDDIQAATVYEMVLNTGASQSNADESQDNTEWVVITSDPTGADVYIDDKPTGLQTPYSRQLPLGSHSYRLSMDMYDSEVGKFDLLENKGKININCVLKSSLGKVEINTTPENGAVLILDGEHLLQTTPCTIANLKNGKHTLSVIKPLFHDTIQTFTISDGKTSILNIKLRPAYGSITLNSKPENGASVTIDEITTGKTTPCTIDKVQSGTHTVTLRREWYAPIKKQFSISDGEKLNLDVLMTAMFSEIKINTIQDADIYINNKKVGTGVYSGRLNEGLYSFEARMANFISDIQKIEINTAESKNITLTPRPDYGTLEIETTPIDAIIKLNGENKGTTPITIRNLISGNYNLTIEKECYPTVSKSIQIETGKTQKISEILPTGLQVKINSSPTGAQLYIDNSFVGKTPLNTTLNFGKHKIKLENGKKITEETITIKEGAETVYNYDVNEIVFVTINCSANKSIVYIDGKKMGETNLTTSLIVGEHKLKIVNGNEVIEKSVRINSSGKNDFNFSQTDFVKSFYQKHFMSVSYGYHETTFANATFTENLKNGFISKDLGHAATVSAIFYPLEVDVTAFSSGFRAHNLPPFNENAVLSHRGIELSINYMPICIAKNFFPYLGAGYQLSQLYSPTGSMSIEGSASTNTSMPVLKGGLKVKFGQLLIFGEYRQTLSINGSTYNSQQLFGGIGWIL
jgi:hypothetical protein